MDYLLLSIQLRKKGVVYFWRSSKTDLPCGSKHVKYKIRLGCDFMFLAYGRKCGLNGWPKDEPQGLEEWKQWLKSNKWELTFLACKAERLKNTQWRTTMSYDVSGSFILEGRLWHIRSTSRINGRSNAHHESRQQHAIHASVVHLTHTVGDF